MLLLKDAEERRWKNLRERLEIITSLLIVLKCLKLPRVWENQNLLGACTRCHPAKVTKPFSPRPYLVIGVKINRFIKILPTDPARPRVKSGLLTNPETLELQMVEKI